MINEKEVKVLVKMNYSINLNNKGLNKKPFRQYFFTNESEKRVALLFDLLETMEPYIIEKYQKEYFDDTIKDIQVINQFNILDFMSQSYDFVWENRSQVLDIDTFVELDYTYFNNLMNLNNEEFFKLIYEKKWIEVNKILRENNILVNDIVEKDYEKFEHLSIILFGNVSFYDKKTEFEKIDFNLKNKQGIDLEEDTVWDEIYKKMQIEKKMLIDFALINNKILHLKKNFELNMSDLIISERRFLYKGGQEDYMSDYYMRLKGNGYFVNINSILFNDNKLLDVFKKEMISNYLKNPLSVFFIEDDDASFEIVERLCYVIFNSLDNEQIYSNYIKSNDRNLSILRQIYIYFEGNDIERQKSFMEVYFKNLLDNNFISDIEENKENNFTLLKLNFDKMRDFSLNQFSATRYLEALMELIQTTLIENNINSYCIGNELKIGVHLPREQAEKIVKDLIDIFDLKRFNPFAFDKKTYLRKAKIYTREYYLEVLVKDKQIEQSVVKKKI